MSPFQKHVTHVPPPLPSLPPPSSPFSPCPQDRTFKLWDIAAGALLYQSPLLGAAALTALAPDPSYPRFAAGFADGALRCASGRDSRSECVCE